MKLSDNFYFEEFLTSQTAERTGGNMLAAQKNPPQEVQDSLKYLVTNTLQPLRSLLNVSFRISSGYRNPELNAKIGGSATSQHVKGEAADVILSNKLKDSSDHAAMKDKIESAARDITGKDFRSNINSNFYLFAYACMNLDKLDVDQVIHEYGSPGQPGWIHISASKDRNKRQILQIGKGVRKELTVKEALLLGC